ncbi:MAG: leucine-rich repeat domain-containing protein [Clostridia bacterium]|nr:leucine-rich repeat domain-containing protein [Clostridia bacterium]
MKKTLATLLAFIAISALIMSMMSCAEDSSEKQPTDLNSGSSETDDNKGADNGNIGDSGNTTPESSYSKGLEFTLSNDETYYLVTGIGSCNDTSVVIPPTHNSKPVKEIGASAFSNCTTIADIKIPDSVTDIGIYAFYNCNNLANISISNSITSVGRYAFGYCSKLQYNMYDNAYYLGNMTNPYIVLTGTVNDYITSCTINENTKLIAPYAFTSCEELITISIPDQITNIGEHAFEYCEGLSSINIGKRITSIGYDAFKDCKSIENISIPDSVTDIQGYAFSGCKELRSVIIPDSVEHIGNHVFDGCEALSDVYVTDIAKWCNIRFPDSKANPMYYADNLYLNGELITHLVIPDCVTKIGYKAFYGCSNIKSIVIPSSVTIIGFGGNAFDGCDQLTDIYYTGTEEDWSTIDIWCDSDAFSNANIHFGYVPEE